MSFQGNFIVFDFETSSAQPTTTQPVELGAVVVSSETLNPIPGAEFISLIRPTDFSTVEAKALEVNKKTIEQLQDAPLLEVVWPEFVRFCQNYKVRGLKGWDGLPRRVGTGCRRDRAMRQELLRRRARPGRSRCRGSR